MTNNAWNSQDPVQVAKGGSGVASHTAYTPLCGGTTTTGAVQSVAALGSSGDVLTSNGAASLPTFQTPTEGSWVFISSQTASTSANLDFISLSSAYISYMFVLDHLITDTGSSSSFRMLLSDDNGSSFLATNYAAGINDWTYNSATWTNNNSTAEILLTGGEINTNLGVSGRVFLNGAGTSSTPEVNGSVIWKVTSTSCNQAQIIGMNSTTGIDAVRFIHGVGNIDTGTIALYGLKTS